MNWAELSAYNAFPRPKRPHVLLLVLDNLFNQKMTAKHNENLKPEAAPWYSNGLSFDCTQCGNCCSGPEAGYVWVTENEVLALAAAIGMSDRLEDFERKFTRQVGTQTSLVEYSDGDCIFLDSKTRTCSVYESRPVQCRTWPFWKSTVATPKAWSRAAKSCPGCNQGRLYNLSEINARLAKDTGDF